MSYIDSNKFSVKVNRQYVNELGENGRVQSTVVVYKGEEQLVAVTGTPIDGQFKVSIASMDGCIASIKNLDTIYVTELDKSIGIITLKINVENKSTFYKSIRLIKSVSVDSVVDIEKRVSIAEQRIKEDSIVNMVRKEFYTKGETNTQMSLVTQEVDNWGVRIVENENDISSLKLTNKEFEVVIGNKADTGNIISMINASTEGITISSNKVDIVGYVTFHDLAYEGSTTINGSNITTGFISGDRIRGGIISATDEINFVGGARIFGNTGDYGAGLSISASGFSFTGGSYSYLGGDWDVGGDLTVSGGVSATNGEFSGLSVSTWINCNSLTTSMLSSTTTSYLTDVYCSYLSSSSSSLGSASSSNLSVSNWISCDSMNTNTLSATSASYLTDVYCSYLSVAGTSVTSDVRLKTDIKYVNKDSQEITDTGLMSPNVKITTSDMHEFIEELPIASYRLIEELNKGKDNTYYGFVIQDIMMTKVGSELVETPRDKYGNVIEDYYSYSQNKFITFICGALQEEIKRSKELENRVVELENKLNKEE